MIEGFTAGFRGFKRDSKLLLGFGLANELAEPPWSEFELKNLLFVSAGSAHQSFRRVVAGDGHAEGSLTG
jgi:hypothetical protein